MHEPLGQLGQLGQLGRLRGVWTVVDGRRMFALVSTHSFPTGLPPVVLVHGLSQSSWYLTPFARQLAPFCPVYIPDLPGFGRSERPPRALTMVELADALAGWMRAMGLERTVILGHSLGCQAVARFAERYPEMLLGAILASPTMDCDTPGLVLFLRGLLNFVYEPFTMTTLVLTGVPRADPWRTWRTFHHALADHCEESYPAIRGPALVVCGTRDPIAPRRWAERVAQMLPERRPLCLLRGHTHAMNLTAPRALLRVTLPFLREVASRGRMPLPQTHERTMGREAVEAR